jgi:hypothetical protein
MDVDAKKETTPDQLPTLPKKKNHWSQFWVKTSQNPPRSNNAFSPALWASGACELDGLTVRGAPIGFRPSLLAGEQRLRIG